MRRTIGSTTFIDSILASRSVLAATVRGTQVHIPCIFKTNAARASHPSRIVIANALKLRLSPWQESVESLHFEKRYASARNLKLALQDKNSALPDRKSTTSELQSL